MITKHNCIDCGIEYTIDAEAKYQRKILDKCPSCAFLNCEKQLSNPTHGHRTLGPNGKPKRTKLYVKWVNMKCSCYTETYKDYKSVGAKGIQMDPSWHTYEGFFKWAMSKFYHDGMILKRIDNNGNYGPKNCRFISKPANAMIEIQGRKATLHEWIKALGSKVPPEIIRGRLEKGWDASEAFLQPVGFKLGRNKRKKKLEAQSGLQVCVN